MPAREIHEAPRKYMTRVHFCIIFYSYQSPKAKIANKGALWENFLVSERLKSNHYHNRFANCYFWRTTDQAKIDYIEEEDGILHAYEFKWEKQSVKFPDSFLEAYPNHKRAVVHHADFEQFVGL